MTTHLPEVIVHSDEILPVRFAKETHGISEPIELPDGLWLVYFGPHEELEQLVHPVPGPSE